MTLQEKTSYSPVYAPKHLVGLIPKEAQSVLDVGAGPGGVGRTLRERGFSGRIVAIEPAADRIASQAEFYDETHACYVEDFRTDHRFDAILMADVLEHLSDPWQTLKTLRELLSPNGVLLVQVPNVMHPDFMLNFLCGDAQYLPAGICDITHIRWFNRVSIVRAVEEAGFAVKSVSRIFKTEKDQYAATQPMSGAYLKFVNHQNGRELLVPAADRADYLTFQYVVSAERGD